MGINIFSSMKEVVENMGRHRRRGRKKDESHRLTKGPLNSTVSSLYSLLNFPSTILDLKLSARGRLNKTKFRLGPHLSFIHAQSYQQPGSQQHD
jgi:hypothetical protein